jgi:lactate racemase
MMNITVPWHAWYGDEELELTFPDGWRGRAYWPADGAEMSDDAIANAFDQPIGSPTIEELARAKCARGRCTVAIAVDDISRPTPAARLMPVLMRRLEAGGIDLDDVTVVLGVGMHRLMTKEEMLKKLGPVACDRLDVHNSFPYDNLADLGVSDRGTPIKVSRHFADADLKIGVGSITPHGGPGFGGGAKVVIPGVSSFETVASMHKPGRLKTGLLNVDDNELRADVEDMAAKIGLDAIVNVVVTARRAIAGVFVGDFVKAHRAGVVQARRVYATPIPSEPVDVVICNAYPKDTDFLQAGLSLNPLQSASLVGRQLVKATGTVVILTASPEGRGYHALYSPGMTYSRRNGSWREHPPEHQGNPILYVSPHITPQDARSTLTFRRWEDASRYLDERYKDPTFAVFPCGALQVAEESVRD